MILRNLDRLTTDPLGFLLILLLTSAALFVCITVHEFSHALAATNLGDTTARRLGRLSLNPLVHLDPLGTLMLFLVGFGWGKPVPVNALAFGPDPFQKMSLVAFAGPLSNFITAAIVAIPFRLGVVHWPGTVDSFFITTQEFLFTQFLFLTMFFSLILGVFNLIPLAPLDGSKVLPGLLPRAWAIGYQRLEPLGPVILMAVILLSLIGGVGILGSVLFPVVNAFTSLLVGEPTF